MLQIKRRDLWKNISLNSMKKKKKKERKSSGNYFVSLVDSKKTWSAWGKKKIRKPKEASWPEKDVGWYKEEFQLFFIQWLNQTKDNDRLWRMYWQWEYNISTLMEYHQGFTQRNICSLEQFSYQTGKRKKKYMN